jgi:hypothetical protein
VFILNEILAKRSESNLPTFLVFIDVRKAYDTVWRNGLWYKLLLAGVGGRCLGMLRAMFENVVRSVLINGARTEGATMETGVPQGSILSPLLYALYINGLCDALLAAGLGSRVYASSPTMMQKMLDVVSAYARKWRFEVNHSKCGLLVFGSALAKRYAELFPWLLCGTEVPVVQYYKYLGLEFSRSALCGKWNIFLKRMLEKTKKRCCGSRPADVPSIGCASGRLSAALFWSTQQSYGMERLLTNGYSNLSASSLLYAWLY